MYMQQFTLKDFDQFELGWYKKKFCIKQKIYEIDIAKYDNWVLIIYDSNKQIHRKVQMLSLPDNDNTIFLQIDEKLRLYY